MTMESAYQNVEVKVPEVLIDLIPKYLENRKLEVTTLEAALNSSDFESIQTIGHKLKGNAGSYGFTDLTILGAKLEQAGKALDAATAAKSISCYARYLQNLTITPV